MKEKIFIEGGKRLSGSIAISGAKTSCLTLMPLSLLTESDLTLKNVPILSDVEMMKALLESLGCIVSYQKSEKTLNLRMSDEPIFLADYEIVKKMRASILVLGPLLAREGSASVSLPGGCAIGARPVDLHLFGLEKLGAKLKLKDDFRTTFYNETSLKLLNNLNILKKIKKNDYTSVKNIKVFGPSHSSPLEWDYFDKKRELGAVIKNDIVLNIIEDKIRDIEQYNSFVNNTECNEFERTLYG